MHVSSENCALQVLACRGKYWAVFTCECWCYSNVVKHEASAVGRKVRWLQLKITVLPKGIIEEILVKSYMAAFKLGGIEEVFLIKILHYLNPVIMILMQVFVRCGAYFFLNHKVLDNIWF